MAIDTIKEQVFTLGEASGRLPSKPSFKTVQRWVDEGALSKKDGHRYMLETVQIGGIRFTSIEAYQRWIAALNGQPPPE